METSASQTMPAPWTDDAPSCTLPTTERPLRQEAFDDLFAETLVEARQPTADHAVLTLAGPTGTGERVRELTAREASCCSFFDFSVTPTDNQVAGEAVTVDVRLPKAHALVLRALVERAEAVAQRSQA